MEALDELQYLLQKGLGAIVEAEEHIRKIKEAESSVGREVITLLR